MTCRRRLFFYATDGLLRRLLQSSSRTLSGRGTDTVDPTFLTHSGSLILKYCQKRPSGPFAAGNFDYHHHAATKNDSARLHALCLQRRCRRWGC